MTDYSIKRFNAYTKEELLGTLRQFADEKQLKYIASDDFCKWLGISPTTISRHFGAWSTFCKEAGLNPRYDRTDDKDILLENLGSVWEALGRQPRSKEMKQPLSAVSNSRYLKVFGNWYQTCLEFLSWKSGLSSKDIARQTKDTRISTPQGLRVKRGISLSLRYDVLKHDRFRCVKCERAPALDPGVVLHVDHIHPHAKGGQTKRENLQTLCAKCNLGKSDRL